MGVTVVFKGGSMNYIEITYEAGGSPDDREEIFVKSNCSPGGPIGFWIGPTTEVYVYFQELHSWVYDHTSEIVVEV